LSTAGSLYSVANFVHSDPIRILIVDSCDANVIKLLEAVREGGFRPEYRQAITPEALKEALRTEKWDIVFGSHCAPDLVGETTLRVVRDHSPDLPYIAVAETIDESSAVMLMKAGATDYVLLRNLARLVPAIRRELRDARERIARRAAESALRESEERFRCLSVSSPVGILLADLTGECVYLNPRCRSILNSTLGRLIGRGWLNAIHPDDRNSVWKEFSAAAGTDEEYSREFRLLLPERMVNWVRFRSAPMRSDKGELTGHVATVEDITQRRRAEQRVAMQYACAKTLSEATSWRDAAPRIMCDVCDSLNIAFAEHWTMDPKAERLRLANHYIPPGSNVRNFVISRYAFSFARGQNLVGLAWQTKKLAWFTDAGRSSTFDFAASARENGVRGMVALPILLQDQTVEVFTFGMLESLDPDDLLFTVMRGLVHQIAQFLERQRLQDEFLQAQKMEVVGMLAGGVAHDFNNLLLVVMGYSDLMLQRLNPSDAMYSDLEEIRKAGERAASLTRQLLAFTRKGPGEYRIVNINQVITDTYKMLRRVMGQHYELVTDLEPDLWSVNCDPGKVDQVLMNMAVNARDAMPYGGRLTITTRNRTVGRRSQNPALSPGDYVIVRIADTGTGMSEDIRGHIFDPFFTTKEKGKGTGLGLATCLTIVREFGGTMDVESAPGEGTTFVISLPKVAAVEAELAPSLHDAEEYTARGERILIVDDEPALRDLTAMVLTEAGFNVLQAANGREALSMFEQSVDKKIDLLLTDVDMPRMSGFELASRILLRQKDVRVIFCTGYASDVVSVAHGKPANAVFVLKPYTPQALVRTVYKTLQTPAKETLTTNTSYPRKTLSHPGRQANP
jgi:two-component system cell cycle sensor histidine kinase/response regulator CckA